MLRNTLNISIAKVLLCNDFQSGGPSWDVPTGRRDGRISSSSEVPNNLPSPLDPIAVQRQKFAAKGLDDRDLVTLVGTFCCHPNNFLVFFSFLA